MLVQQQLATAQLTQFKLRAALTEHAFTEQLAVFPEPQLQFVRPEWLVIELFKFQRVLVGILFVQLRFR